MRTRTILAHGTEEPLSFQRKITYLQHLAPWHLEEARAALARLRNGPLPEEIEAARARVQQANAAYRKALAGARPQELSSATRAVSRCNSALAGRKGNSVIVPLSWPST